MDLFFELLPEEDIPTAHAIELDGTFFLLKEALGGVLISRHCLGFPPDEAATLEAFRYRQGNAPDLFLGAYIAPRQLVGYVCSTASSFPTLTHESMSKHEPNAPSVCIHSVCVAPNHRKKGIALRLLQSYLDRLQSTTSYERVLLITHEELRVLYEAAGFEFVGESAVQHGPKPWFEMRKVLRSPLTHVLSEGRQDTIDSSLGQPAIAQADILAALMQQQSSSRTRPPAALLDSFNEGAVGTSVPVGSDLVNAYALVCPRAGCGSTILLARAATLVEKESIQV
ncbi:acyl-CoA N-acyltransferase [Punctularia strigosozonata HHB-11173 SS5]|uniref:acyl-CoA N-acyltransferase n=1 Tax=Punctularia strigosozonata (strain HHB-11173) TaxID=741275 RepID=UPI0004416E66|nr:acyl-CoA N-acyltransferase [Punctularia strigosozonata HHB-11173 SS5]EIN05526.1 acyl-CoA N-acyltransferase [Punctularia strigosozonata HHB-11173 SS5]